MPDFWDGKRVTVTGGAGFLGQRIVERLSKKNVEGIFVPRSAEYDLTLLRDVRRMYNDALPDIVIHAAAVVGGIGANRDNPAKFFYDNLMMGALMIDSAHWFGMVQKFVMIGTVCSYPKYAQVPFKEDDLWNGYPEETNAPYGIAKKALLVQGQAYRQQYGLNSIFLLPVNMYGPDDNFDLETSHVIPALVKKCLESTDELVVWGDGTPTREFLYVDDCADAILMATEKYNSAEPLNIGTGREISIRNLVEMIVELTEFKGKVVWDKSKPNGQPRRCLDVSRAKKAIGFTAKIGLENGIRNTINWYKSVFQGESHGRI